MSLRCETVPTHAAKHPLNPIYGLLYFGTAVCNRRRVWEWSHGGRCTFLNAEAAQISRRKFRGPDRGLCSRPA